MNQKLTYMYLSCLALILSTTVLSQKAYSERQYRDEYQSREIIQMPEASKGNPTIKGVGLELKPGLGEKSQTGERLNYPEIKVSDSNKLDEEAELSRGLTSKAKARALLSLITLSALRGSNQP